MAKRVAVWLLNYGGPRCKEEVYPFLLELFNDPFIFPYKKFYFKYVARYIAKKRTPKLIEIYEKMGRFSPIWEETEKQASCIRENMPSNVEIFTGMRYFVKELKETGEKIVKGKFDLVILFPLYPQESETTTSSSIFISKKILEDLNFANEIVAIRSFYGESGFISAIVDLTRKELQKSKYKPKFIFTAHSLPLKLALMDNYFEEVKATAKLVGDQLLIPIKIGPPSKDSWEEGIVAFQSKVGPLKWLEPSVEEVILEWGQGGCKSIIVVPISFVSEHSETLYELDILYKGIAEEMGMEYLRVPTVSTHPMFIESLCAIIRRVINE